MNQTLRIGRGFSSAVGFFLLLAAGCQTVPPPPPPAPPPVIEEPVVDVKPVEKPPEPQVFVRVVANRLNVRQGPGTDQPSLGKVKKGDRLLLAEGTGEWWKIFLEDGREGWVKAEYVRREEPCLPDNPQPALISGPVLSFEQGSRGVVVIHATVDAAGRVVATKIVRNTTGDETLVQLADSEVRQMIFSPPVKNCRSFGFVYVYTRNF